MPEEEVMLKEEEVRAYEPLSAVEKKLIGWSLGIGIVLLVILIFATGTFK